jgi:hypothetical protein
MLKKKWFKVLLLIVIVLMIVYLFGPHPKAPVYNETLPVVPSQPTALDQYVQNNEAQHKLKPNNEARIVWLTQRKQKQNMPLFTCMVFLPSQEEGRPIHTNIAKEFGCNLYLSRLAGHGIDTTQPMINLTADELWESAKQALQIGKQLGNKGDHYVNLNGWHFSVETGR